MWIFFKTQISSLLATIVDFSITVFLIEALKIHYLSATVIGAVGGAVINFVINKYWSFQKGKYNTIRQGYRYAFVWTGSILLNVLGLYTLTGFLKLNYIIAKLFTSIAVGIGFNYTLQKRYVFNSNEGKIVKG